MADKKISALTAASTPLAGSEVLPIVQSSATVKVSVDNLWAGRVVTSDGFRNQRPGVATQYIEQVAAGGGTFLNIVNNANSANMSYQVVRTTTAGTTYPLLLDSNDNYQIQLGNVIFSTAAKGVNFTANTPAAGMTSQLLNWYEEGTWTPVATAGSGAITTYSSSGRYTRVGRQVFLQGRVTLTTVGTAGGRLIVDGFPFTIASTFTPSSTCREVAATGVIYAVFGETGGVYGYVSSLTNGAIAWTDGYIYDFNLVYTV